MKILTRKDAKNLGFNYYLNGKKCTKCGTFSKRYVKNCSCVYCRSKSKYLNFEVFFQDCSVKIPDNWGTYTYTNKNYEESYVGDKLLKTRLNSARQRATKKGLEFDLDLPFLESLLELQTNRCNITGTEFTDDNTPSIDRVDSTKGYTKDNVQLVTYKVNTMKSDLPMEEFVKLCKLVIKNY